MVDMKRLAMLEGRTELKLRSIAWRNLHARTSSMNFSNSGALAWIYIQYIYHHQDISIEIDRKRDMYEAREKK